MNIVSVSIYWGLLCMSSTVAYRCGIPQRCQCYEGLQLALCSQQSLTSVPIFTDDELSWITVLDIKDNKLSNLESLDPIYDRVHTWNIYIGGNDIDCHMIEKYLRNVQDMCSLHRMKSGDIMSSLTNEEREPVLSPPHDIDVHNMKDNHTDSIDDNKNHDIANHDMDDIDNDTGDDNKNNNNYNMDDNHIDSVDVNKNYDNDTGYVNKNNDIANHNTDHYVNISADDIDINDSVDVKIMTTSILEKVHDPKAVTQDRETVTPAQISMTTFLRETAHVSNTLPHKSNMIYLYVGLVIVTTLLTLCIIRLCIKCCMKKDSLPIVINPQDNIIPENESNDSVVLYEMKPELRHSERLLNKKLKKEHVV